jgi:S1-C subfamily serine protease
LGLPLDAPPGVIVVAIRPGSAARNDLSLNDVVLKVNGKDVTSADDIDEAVKATGIGGPVRLDLWSAGGAKFVYVRVERPPL